MGTELRQRNAGKDTLKRNVDVLLKE